MMSSMEKWPVGLVVTKVLASDPDNVLSLYLVAGVMNASQRDTLVKQLPLQIEINDETPRILVSGLVTHEQLTRAYEALLPRSSDWRGQYYVIANKFVDAYREATAIKR